MLGKIRLRDDGINKEINNEINKKINKKIRVEEVDEFKIFCDKIDLLSISQFLEESGEIKILTKNCFVNEIGKTNNCLFIDGINKIKKMRTIKLEFEIINTKQEKNEDDDPDIISVKNKLDIILRKIFDEYIMDYKILNVNTIFMKNFYKLYGNKIVSIIIDTQEEKTNKNEK